MAGSSLLTVRQIAGILEETPERLNYIISKCDIEPTSRMGLIRLFNWNQVRQIRKNSLSINDRDREKANMENQQ